jgi:NACHT conflict system protein
MFDPMVLTAFGALFGQAGGALLRKAAEKHVETFFEKTLDKVASVGQKSAFQEAMERAYGGWTEAVLKNLEGLGYDAEDLAEYRGAFERMLQADEVGHELIRPLLDGADWRGPDVVLFQDSWARLPDLQLRDVFLPRTCGRTRRRSSCRGTSSASWPVPARGSIRRMEPSRSPRSSPSSGGFG